MSLRVDRIIPGVGRIARYIGSTDEEQLELCNAAITRLAKNRRVDVLEAFRDGEIDPDTLFLVAHGQKSLADVLTIQAKLARDPEADCFVYAILRRDTREVKLGIARNVGQRLTDLQTGNAGTLELLGTMVGGPMAEAEIHARFAHLRLNGEWFRYVDDLEEYLERAFAKQIPIIKSISPLGDTKAPSRLSDARPMC